MTQAVCRKCGEIKFGAFVSCSKCGYQPESPRDQAESLLLTDHFLSKDDLEGVSETIRSGEDVRFDEAQLEEMAKDIENAEPLDELKGCVWVWRILLVIMFSLLAFVIYSFVTR